MPLVEDAGGGETEYVRAGAEAAQRRATRWELYRCFQYRGAPTWVVPGASLVIPPQTHSEAFCARRATLEEELKNSRDFIFEIPFSAAHTSRGQEGAKGPQVLSEREGPPRSRSSPGEVRLCSEHLLGCPRSYLARARFPGIREPPRATRLLGGDRSTSD